MKKVEFTIQDIIPIAIVFVVATIAISYGATVLANLKASQVAGQAVTATCNSSSGVYTGCGYAYNATGKGEESLWNLATNLPLIALIIVAAIIIGVLITYLYVKFMK